MFSTGENFGLRFGNGTNDISENGKKMYLWAQSTVCVDRS